MTGKFYAQIAAALAEPKVRKKYAKKPPLKMRCPKCKLPGVQVYDSREVTMGRMRRRVCVKCKFRWQTIEVPIELLEALQEE